MLAFALRGKIVVLNELLILLDLLVVEVVLARLLSAVDLIQQAWMLLVEILNELPVVLLISSRNLVVFSRLWSPLGVVLVDDLIAGTVKLTLARGVIVTAFIFDDVILLIQLLLVLLVELIALLISLLFELLILICLGVRVPAHHLSQRQMAVNNVLPFCLQMLDLMLPEGNLHVNLALVLGSGQRCMLVLVKAVNLGSIRSI